MVRGIVIEGPRETVGQSGEFSSPERAFVTEVIGIEVVNPNLDGTGRQGLLLNMI